MDHLTKLQKSIGNYSSFKTSQDSDVYTQPIVDPRGIKIAMMGDSRDSSEVI